MSCLSGDETRIVVQVKPGSSRGPRVDKTSEGNYVVYVREEAIDGQANTAVIKALATHFDVPKSSITIVRGLTSRIKQVVIYV